MRNSIAIDGPSGAGKSTLAKKTARSLGYLYLDTGAMYRAFGLYAAEHGVDFQDGTELAACINALAEDFTLRIVYENGSQQVWIGERNVTDLIRTPEISIAASKVAAIPAVRFKLVEIQRQIAAEHDVVMDGRDIGSYVLPNARVKIFLTASPEVRARRRLKELQNKGDHSVTFESVLEDMKFRDANDRSRAFAPLVQTEDAILLDTSGMTEKQSEEALLSIIKSRLGEA